MSDEVRFPALGEALATNRRFTGLAVRDVGLLESALLRPQSSAFGQDAYPDLWSKAAALMHSIIRNHPFLEANKRTATALALGFLVANGVEAARSPDQDAMVSIAVAIANIDLDVARISVALRAAVEGNAPFDPREMLQ